MDYRFPNNFYRWPVAKPASESYFYFKILNYDRDFGGLLSNIAVVYVVVKAKLKALYLLGVMSGHSNFKINCI